MFNVEEIWNCNEKMINTTGLKIEEANLVFDDFKAELKKIRRPKKPNSTVGRPSKLNDKEIFIMLMIFIRQYSTYKFLSVLFSIDASNVKRWIDDAHLALGEVLVKKNFAHLLLIDHERFSKSALEDWEKSILMDLNNLFEDQKTI